MVYDEIIRLAEETQKIARVQKAQQTIDRMRLERIKELNTEIHDRINCVYAGEEDHLIENVLQGKRTINTNTLSTAIQVSETKRTQKGKQVITSKL
jgi:hypothetical protein